MFYDEEKRRYVDVTKHSPLPVTVVVRDAESSEDETVTVTVTRNTDGDTTKVVEHSDLTGKTTTTNFTYLEA